MARLNKRRLKQARRDDADALSRLERDMLWLEQVGDTLKKVALANLRMMKRGLDKEGGVSEKVVTEIDAVLSRYFGDVNVIPKTYERMLTNSKSLSKSISRRKREARARGETRRVIQEDEPEYVEI